MVQGKVKQKNSLPSGVKGKVKKAPKPKGPKKGKNLQIGAKKQTVVARNKVSAEVTRIINEKNEELLRSRADTAVGRKAAAKMKLVDQLTQLYNNELWEDLVLLYEISSFGSQQKGFLPKTQAFIHTYAADAYMEMEKYAPSHRAFLLALEAHKAVTRSIVSPKNLTEPEVRWRLHKCLLKLKKQDDAVSILQAIPSHQVTPKVRYALMRLQSGKTPDSITSIMSTMSEIVSACPSAVKCASYVISNGGSLRDAITVPDDVPFAKIWEKVQELLGKGELVDAIRLLLDNSALAPKMAALEAGKLLNVMGMREEACIELQKAYNLDNDMVEGVCLLAHLYARDEGHIKELETLAFNINMHHPSSLEAYIVNGHLMRHKNVDIALFFAEKAIDWGARPCSDAILLKALLISDQSSEGRRSLPVDKYDESINILQRGLYFDPSNYDLHETLTVVHMHRNRFESAKKAAMNVVNLVPNSPRAQFLHATVLLKSKSEEQGLRILEELVDKHPYYSDAVYLTIETLRERKQNERAIKLLKKVMECPTISSRPHTARYSNMLGELLMKNKQPLEAYEHVHRAIIMGEDAHPTLVQLELLTSHDSVPSIGGAPEEATTPSAQVTPQSTSGPPNPCPSAPRRRRAVRRDDSSMVSPSR